MCIIISKEKSARLPKEEELKQSFEYNSDGAGFMYVENGQVVIDKGYMKYDEFIGHYRNLLKKFNNFKDKSLVIHCRIGTSGGNTRGNTHPYPITNNVNLLHNTKLFTDIGIAHNGIIHGYGQTTGINDTQEFIMKYIHPLHENWKYFYKNDEMLKGLEEITNSKLAILDNDEEIYYVGNFIEDDGLKFSNTTYKSYKTYSNYTSNSYKWYDKKDETSKFETTTTEDFDEERDWQDYYDNYDDFGGYEFEDKMRFELLDSSYFVDLKGNGIEYEPVGNRKLWFDWFNYILYEEINGEFVELSKNAIIYDRNYSEIN